MKASGTPVKDHRAIFLGAGSAGVGVARQIVEYFIKEGLTEEEARRKFWFVDSNVGAPIFWVKHQDLTSNRALSL